MSTPLKIDEEVYRNFKKFCIDLGLPVYKVTETLYKVSIYLLGKADAKTSTKVSEDVAMLLYLTLAREKMVQRGLDTKGVEQAIATVESFLEKRGNENEKRANA
ncbi:MAG: hypothetical protein ACPLZY_03495 [Candidatus Norongarragalinales archaeon]